MDTKRLYVDFHVLQTVPPSCVNRDDTGSPKTAVLLRTRMPSNWPRRSLQMQASRAMTRAQKRCFS